LEQVIRALINFFVVILKLIYMRLD